MKLIMEILCGMLGDVPKSINQSISMKESSCTG